MMPAEGPHESLVVNNLADDPAESRDLAGARPERVEALRAIQAEQERLDR